MKTKFKEITCKCGWDEKVFDGIGHSGVCGCCGTSLSCAPKPENRIKTTATISLCEKILDLIGSGVVYVKNGVVYGISNDGVHVVLGSTESNKEITQVNNYIKNMPNPSDW